MLVGTPVLSTCRSCPVDQRFGPAKLLGRWTVHFSAGTRYHTALRVNRCRTSVGSRHRIPIELSSFKVIPGIAVSTNCNWRELFGPKGILNRSKPPRRSAELRRVKLVSCSGWAGGDLPDLPDGFGRSVSVRYPVMRLLQTKALVGSYAEQPDGAIPRRTATTANWHF